MRHLCLLFAVAALGVACEPTDEERAAEIWLEIDGWEGWDDVAPWTGIQPSSDCTHGPYVEITYNAVAAPAWGEESLPDGSIVVKRGHNAQDGSDPVGFVTVMKKIEGYDPDTGDWFWLRIDDQGNPSSTEIGRASFCSGCHSAGGTDYLLTVRDDPGDGSCGS